MKIKASWIEQKKQEVDVDLEDILSKLERVLLNRFYPEPFNEYELKIRDDGRLIRCYDMQGHGNDIHEDITITLKPSDLEMLKQWGKIKTILRKENRWF